MNYQLASRPPAAWTQDRSNARADYAFENVAGQSLGIRGAVEYAKKMALGGLTNLLLVGESGTGKSLFARAIHAASRQGDEPFVTVNCGTIPAPLLESELFGHEPRTMGGAQERREGLIELAGCGVVFLNDIGRIPPSLQPKLLRALEEQRARRVGGRDEFDVRCSFIATTTHALEESVAEGTFREDLFYRLNGLRISLPPLRDREGDIEILAHHFLDEVVCEQGLLPKTLAEGAVTALESHHWPGNVRELKHVIFRAALVCGGTRVFAKHLRIQNRKSYTLLTEPPVGEITIPSGGKPLEEIEAEALRLTLQLTGGNQSAAARTLHISRPTLLRKVRKYGLEPALTRRLAV
jgi:transcriptional regulator with PAS, ATPase and Fis domain